MSLIVCNENCKHQQEGYCILNQIACLTSDASAKCGYFSALPDSAAPPSGMQIGGEEPAVSG